jgi:hypothetical protein
MSKLTEEQKGVFGPMLQRTWQAIAPDAEPALSLSRRKRTQGIIEMTCDANLPEMYGRMTREQYRELTAAYYDPDTQEWLREVLDY